MKKIFSAGVSAFLFLILNSCNNSTEPFETEDIFFETPAVTGMIITSDEGPRALATWRHPLYPETVVYPALSSKPDKIPADVRPISGSNVMDLQNPYPNPSCGYFRIGLKVAVNTKVSLWLLKGRLPEESANGLETGAGGAFVSPNNPASIILLNKQTMAAVNYMVEFDGKIEGKPIPSGFYRIYFKADGHLFWRDVFIALKKTDVPPDLVKYFNLPE